ncbi:unnamed protein product, partial [Oppiella nova]
TTALQIALIEVIKALDITPDGIIGHSFGEIACAYADGCLSTRQAMLMSYFRGSSTLGNDDIPKGLMAVVGLSRDEALKWCPNGVSIACNNAKESVVVTVWKGYIPNPKLRSDKWLSTCILTESCDEMLKYGSAEYFVYNMLNEVHFYERLQQLPSNAIVLELSPHPIFVRSVTETLENSTFISLLKKDSNHTNLDLFFSGLAKLYELGINLSIDKLYPRVEWPVARNTHLQQLPSNAIVLELSPHPIFVRSVTETLENSTFISLLKKDSNHTNLDLFLSGLAKLYELGINLSIDRLYPRVEWPVARNTQSIGSLIKWDHSFKYSHKLYPENYNRFNASDMNIYVDPIAKEDAFYLDHSLNGRAIFPGAGYLMLAWRMLAAGRGRIWYQLPVIFENIHFKSFILLSQTSVTHIKVKLFPTTDEFVVIDSNGNVCVSGTVRAPGDGMVLTSQYKINSGNGQDVNGCEYTLGRDDIYKKMRILGYDYGPEFQRLCKVETNDFHEIYGICEWTGNCVTFLDGLLQSMIVSAHYRKLMVPVMMRRLRVDPMGNDDNIVDKVVDRNVYRFALMSADIPFNYNNKTKHLISYGVEVEGMSVQPIASPTDDTDVVLDSYEFIANDDINAIDECLKLSICNYLEAYCSENWVKSPKCHLKTISFTLPVIINNEPGGEDWRYVFNYDSKCETKIDFNSKPFCHILANDLVANVIKDGKVGTYRHIKLPQNYDKTVSNEYFLNLGQTRDISALQWFRRMPSGPESEYTDCSIGLEFAGRRADTGHRVMGLEIGRCFATSIYASTHAISPIPDHWSMDDAVTILSTYSTAYYGLIQMAKLRTGESVLIHSAAGGVGQAALNICQHYKCDIYATVGTDEKKEFLIKEYKIPSNRIFNSRDT